MMRRLVSPSSSAIRLGAWPMVTSRMGLVAPAPGDSTQSKHPQPLRGVDLNRLSFVSEVHKQPEFWSNPVEHPVWDLKDASTVAVNHKPIGGVIDVLAYAFVRLLRWSFDTFSGFRFGKLTEAKVINRCLFLETVAGVPGMVGGMLRHMSSLRRMQRDHGWIHTLLEEAENERMHLLTFMELRKPGIVFRGSILVAQGVFFNLLFILYLLCPRFVHRFVGYLEEEAVITYTHILEAIDDGTLPQFKNAKCPPVARSYWKLPDDASFRDMINVIRADEAGHRLVNHTFADMHAQKMADATNPFVMYGSVPESFKQAEKDSKPAKPAQQEENDEGKDAESQ